MKTLFWSGSLCQSAQHGQSRIWRWWYYYQQHKGALDITHWALFNDGPDNLPLEWFVSPHTFAADPALPDRLNVYYHPNHLGRTGPHQFPGFWRNLHTALRVCREQAFDRFILIEGDAFILNGDMLHEIGRTTRGLVTYWCPTYQIPETGIVICGSDRYQRLEEQVQAIRDKTQCTEADRFETAMDWTEVRKHRKGDRYAETGRAVPVDAHYCCQLTPWAVLQEGLIIDAIT